MGRSVFRTVLVIGDNHEEIIKKYSLDTVVKPYVKYKRKDASKLQKKQLLFLENVITNPLLTLSEKQKELYKELYLSIKEMSDFEFYLYITKGCKYDETNGDAISTENPNAYYKFEKCYQKRLMDSHGEIEAQFSDPFKLKDGTKSYVARYNDIDWDLMHLHGTHLYQRAWELCVDDEEPENEQEEKIKNSMSKRQEYFMNFNDCDEYIRHSCSFWTYGVATENNYEEVNFQISDKDWVANFFDKYIKDIKNNPTLAIYEVRSLND